MPIFLRVSPISWDAVAPILFPFRQLAPERGLSRPSSARTRVLLPDPEPPRLPRATPLVKRRAMPCEISRATALTRVRRHKRVSPENSHGVRPDRQARQHGHDGEKFRSDQEMNRIDGPRLQRVNFLRDLHGANFRGEGRT